MVCVCWRKCNIERLPIVRYYFIYLLTAVRLTPCGSSKVHIYTQVVHRIRQWEQTAFWNLEVLGNCWLYELFETKTPIARYCIVHSAVIYKWTWRTLVKRVWSSDCSFMEAFNGLKSRKLLARQEVNQTLWSFQTKYSQRSVNKLTEKTFREEHEAALHELLAGCRSRDIWLWDDVVKRWEVVVWVSSRGFPGVRYAITKTLGNFRSLCSVGTSFAIENATKARNASLFELYLSTFHANTHRFSDSSESEQQITVDRNLYLVVIVFFSCTGYVTLDCFFKPTFSLASGNTFVPIMKTNHGQVLSSVYAGLRVKYRFIVRF
jgi:hypothetical protein